MKLYAVVDKDGDIIRTFMIWDNAYEYAGIHGGEVIELHTYDPATQVVVDRDVFETLYSRAGHPIAFYDEVAEIPKEIWDRLITKVQPKCSCIPYEYGSGNEVPDNSKCPVHGKEAT